MKKIWLIIELWTLFFMLPLIFYFEWFPFPKIPALLLTTAYAFIILWRDKNFARIRLWNTEKLSTNLQKIIIKFIPASLVLVVLTVIITPETLFIFPRQRPFIWAIVMLLYPIFSAYSQELIYRTFFFHRYRQLFPADRWMIGMSASTFCFLHIIYDNPIAIVLSLIGGLLFSVTYQRSQSLLTTSIEHGLYGQFIFTIGLGHYFYEGF